MTYIIIVVILAIFANIAIRRYLAKMDNLNAATGDKPSPINAQIKYVPVQPSDVLQTWGKAIPGKIDQGQHLNASLLKVLEKYQTIGPDEYFVPIDRKFADRPFSENNEFTRIGTWGDGSEVLAKRNPLDNAVYLADFEDGDTARPKKIADSLDEYLLKAWDYHQDSLHQS